MKKCDLSLVLASYNEGATFEQSVNIIIKSLEKLKLHWEIIFVEDKSLDGTKEKINKFTKQNKKIRAIYHSTNEGRGKSVSDGIFASKSEICGFMDVDCEISPNYIPAFIKEVKNGGEIVVANRYYDKNFKAINRILASYIYRTIIKNTLGLSIQDTEAGFKFFKRSKIIPVLKTTKDNGWFWDTEICARAILAGLKTRQVQVQFKKRSDKKSTVRLFRDSALYLTKLINFQKEYSKLKKSI